MGICDQVSQAFPPAPKFTESSIPSLAGKVYIVTGASAGVGRELARLLYSLNGTVYVAARNAEKSTAAIAWMRESHPSSTGRLEFLKLDLNDLTGIKASAEEFLAKEKRLDVLFNNAGVMVPPQGSLTAQGFDLQLGTNCIAHFLFTKFLTPLLVSTAAVSDTGSVRVIWVSSSAAHVGSPKGGVDVKALGDGVMATKNVRDKYAISKGGNVLHAIEFANRYADKGVLSVSLNPGNLKTELGRHIPPLVNKVLTALLLHPAVNGAYTELYAGLSPDVVGMKKGEWVVPFGRIMSLRKDLAEGGNAREFWEWTEKVVEKYL
ncbi:hypothetical protein HBI47_096690 [Parastagonospora nodorum]|nr:hypothetical protein HBI47_096690 [Parastagonospora nodorum]